VGFEMGRLRYWLFVLPLLVVGCELAQAILNLFAPDGYKGIELFEGGSRELVPLAIGIAAATLLLALVSSLGARRRARPSPWWMLATFPLLVFTVQEHVEYVLGHGHVPWTLATQPSFIAGFLLQIPFAAVACFGARLLLRLAESLPARARGVPFIPRLVDEFPRPAVLRRTPSRARLPGDARLNRGPPLTACG
jgi:hypothetical protein